MAELKERDQSTSSEDEDFEKGRPQQQHQGVGERVIAIEFNNIVFSVTSRPKMCFGPPVEKVILNNLSGAFYVGELVAVMGPSGAGKTTFLNLIAGRGFAGGKLRGTVKINNVERTWKNREKFKKSVAYVAQDDTLFHNLTTKETFDFSAKLTLPKKTKRSEREAKVKEIVDELSLRRAVNTKVGIPGLPGGVSGGERKRVSVGVEMIFDPDIIFLDEPTSGLDSWTARSIISKLKKLTRVANKTIIVTIHQPATDVFNLFDRVFLLARGEFMYTGPVPGVLDYFASKSYPCGPYINPAEHIMDVVQPGFGMKTKTEIGSEEDIRLTAERIAFLSNEYRDHPMAKEHEGGLKGDGTIKKMKGGKNNWLVEFLILTHRATLQTYRDPMKTMARLIQMIFMSLLCGIIFYQLGDDQTSIQDRTGVLFFAVMGSAFPFVMSVLSLFPPERRVFTKEYTNGTYAASSYFVAKIVTELPFSIILPMIFSAILYFMVGLRTDSASHFFIFYAMIVVLSMVCTGLGLLISTGIKNFEVSLGLSTLALIPMMMFGGFYVNLKTVMWWLRWLQYLSIFKYSFEILIINEFKDLAFSCSGAQTSSNPQMTDTPQGNNTISVFAPSCYSNGNQYIETLGMNSDNMGRDFGILILFLVFFNIMSFIFLKLSVRNG